VRRPAGAKPGLLYPSDLRYLGAIRLPAGPPAGQKWASSFAYGGGAMAYNPKRDSLFLLGHDHHQLVAEISVPRPVRSRSVAALPVARVLQPFADVTGGLRKEGWMVGGLLVDRDRLLWTAYVYYDAPAAVKVSHGFSTLDLSRPNARGIYSLANVPAGAVAGYMAHVPDDWRERFGARVLTGQAGIPIVTRTSAGPAAVGFDPDQLGPQPAPTGVFLYYPLAHPLDRLDRKSDVWNFASGLGGMAFVSRGGKAAVMFFGRRGLGEYWYGLAEEGGKKDPASIYKGPHAPPYSTAVWFYDPADLLAVKEGLKRPWEARPYHVAPLPGAFPSPTGELGGVAYDPRSGRLYVAQPRGDRESNPYEPLPVVHVVEVAPTTP
jgi:hypothetical protein